MKNFLTYGTKPLATVLVTVLICQITTKPANSQTVPRELSIMVVEGEGAINRVNQRASHDPVIRIEDENKKPLADAAAVFTLPTEGATGVFGNGAKTITVMSDRQGMAIATGLRVNQMPGRVQIHVNVSYKGLTGRTSITQFSEAPAGYKPERGGGGNGKLIAIIAVLAAAGAGGAYFATRKSGSSASTPTVPPVSIPSIGITPGTGVISPPH
jgi:hypothetical protein